MGIGHAGRPRYESNKILELEICMYFPTQVPPNFQSQHLNSWSYPSRIDLISFSASFQLLTIQAILAHIHPRNIKIYIFEFSKRLAKDHRNIFAKRLEILDVSNIPFLGLKSRVSRVEAFGQLIWVPSL